MLIHRRRMLGIVADSEKAAMDLRVERLHPAVHHLRKAGEIGDVANVRAGLAKLRSGPAGRDQLDPVLRECFREGIEPTITADGMGAILRSPGAPPWNFRSRGAAIGVEESLVVDGQGIPHRTMQLVINGEAAASGAEVHWQFRRSS
jgi:uncharacterized heparinase superfamily protein